MNTMIFEILLCKLFTGRCIADKPQFNFFYLHLFPYTHFFKITKFFLVKDNSVHNHSRRLPVNKKLLYILHHAASAYWLR